MGFIRGSTIVLVSILFVALVIITGAFATLSSSLSYKVIKSDLVPVVKEFIFDQNNLSSKISDSYPLMVASCANNEEYVLGEGDNIMTIKCEDVIGGPEAVVSAQIDDFVDRYYYKEYTCDFWECRNTELTPFYLVSDFSRSYFASKFYIFFFISILVFVALFFLSEVKSNAFILSGVLMLVGSVPFLMIKWIFSFLALQQYLQFFSFLFTQSSSVFLKILITGIVLVVFGFLMKIFDFGMKIEEFFERFKKKEEKKK